MLKIAGLYNAISTRCGVIDCSDVVNSYTLGVYGVGKVNRAWLIVV